MKRIKLLYNELKNKYNLYKLNKQITKVSNARMKCIKNDLDILETIEEFGILAKKREIYNLTLNDLKEKVAVINRKVEYYEDLINEQRK